MFKSPVTILYLPEECFDGRSGVLEAVVNFYEAITDERRSPDNAGKMLKVLRDVAIYIGEVQNGGHGQHLDNEAPTEAELTTIGEAFRATGAIGFASVVDLYIKQARPGLAGKDVPNGPDYYTLLSPLDAQYFSLETEKNPDAYFTTYLAAQPWVKKMPEREFYKGISALQKLAFRTRQTNAPDPVGQLASMIRSVISPDPDRPWWK